MVSSTYSSIHFKSDAFPEREGEADTINPGLFGEAFAEYLAEQLKKAGFDVGTIGAEDLWMYIPISNKDFKVFVNCVNEEDSENEFRVDFEPQHHTITKWFKKIDTRHVMEPLIQAVTEILRSDSSVTEIRFE